MSLRLGMRGENAEEFLAPFREQEGFPEVTYSWAKGGFSVVLGPAEGFIPLGARPGVHALFQEHQVHRWLRAGLEK